MSFIPYLATVIDSQRISPNFQRVRLSGLDNMGPAVPIRDLRIKLILPGPHGLIDLPEDWFGTWRAADPATRGVMRTYSVRALSDGLLTIDFALHHGPASHWATHTRPGDQIHVIAPTLNDDSGSGIEFNPGNAHTAHLYGDDTALPAIAQILTEWPAGLRGTVHLDLPDPADRQELLRPAGVDIHWLDRTGPAGTALIDALATQLGQTPTAADTTEDSGPGTFWETPNYSSLGEELDSSTTAEGEYWWIAGEAGIVKQMRRMLVRDAGIPRAQVSFMGYWKRGFAEGS